MSDNNKPFENKYSTYRAINEIKEEKQDVITIKHNTEDRKKLELFKVAIQQEKDSTAYKSALDLAIVILDTPEGQFFKIALDNIRKNKRLGIVEVVSKNEQK